MPGSADSSLHKRQTTPTTQLDVHERRVQLELALLELEVEAKREGMRSARHARARADLKLAMMGVAITGLISGVPGALLDGVRALAGV